MHDRRGAAVAGRHRYRLRCAAQRACGARRARRCRERTALWPPAAGADPVHQARQHVCGRRRDRRRAGRRRLLEIGASVAVVFARRATRVPAALALDYLHGFTLASDVSVPHPDYYRPAVRFKCRDGFCPMGPAIVPAAALGNVDTIGLTVRIDGEVAVSVSTATLIRSVRELIADVTAFMSFDAGDVLLLGVAGGAPRARAGSTIEIAAAGIGTLRHTLIAEETR
ncbi:2-hydroxyhepta-2,4-diene-1,7-dioate isomerase [Burkholderia cepacia]|nr:2-hydroxyhepta-2,4-diene-1,7-dioate isomerase [Burkholderia cepacia]